MKVIILMFEVFWGYWWLRYLKFIILDIIIIISLVKMLIKFNVRIISENNILLLGEYMVSIVCIMFCLVLLLIRILLGL